MQPIPDTGGGVSGFLAYLLWHVYRCFPFPGTWDWLVLIGVIAVSVPILFLPYMWRLVNRPLGAADRVHDYCVAWDAAWIGLAVWFFHTPGGQTFFQGRHGVLLGETNWPLFWGYAAFCLVLPILVWEVVRVVWRGGAARGVLGDFWWHCWLAPWLALLVGGVTATALGTPHSGRLHIVLGGTMPVAGLLQLGVLHVMLRLPRLAEATVAAGSELVFTRHSATWLMGLLDRQERWVAHQERRAAELGLPVEVTDRNGIKFRLIPPGEFLMGSSESEAGRQGDESPQHRVRISKAFYLGVYPVTQEQWYSVMGSNPSCFQGPQNPVENASWNDVQEFVRKLNEQSGEPGGVYRLPTEAQWEYACRAGVTTRYCFGTWEWTLGEYAWYRSNSGGSTHPVGQKRPNAWGLHDMHGNVWEWCSDWYDSSYYARSPVDDPQGPAGGSSRVFRGGGWCGGAFHCRASCRGGRGPVRRFGFRGFRLVRAVF